jgi:hypothetical protein
MGIFRLAAVAWSAAFCAGAAWGQDGVKETKKVLTKPGFDKEADAAAIKKKLQLACKKTGDCKPDLLEKKKAEKKRGDASGAPGFGEVVVPEGVPVGEAAEALGTEGGTEPTGDAEPGDADPGPGGEQAEAARQESGERRMRAMDRAAGAADTLRRSLFEAEAGAEEGADGARKAASSSGAGGGSSGSVQELALAERAGYAATFRAQGLAVGAGPAGEPAVLRRDGSPASEADLGRLRAALSREPAALRRRPDYFEVLPRARYESLKEGYAERPELRPTAFRHIALTGEGRDFRWSQSCSGVSGDCNPHAGEASYRKGEDVPPEVLDEVWDAFMDEADVEDDEEDWGEYDEEDRRLAAEEDAAAAKLASGKGFLPSLSSLLSRLGGFGRSAGEEVGPVSGRAVPPPAGVFAAAGAAEGMTSADGSDAGIRGAGSPEARSRSEPPPAPRSRRAAVRGSLYALAALAAGAFLLLGLRRALSPSSGR